MSIEKKVALVTGASRGIGRAIAMTLAKQQFADYVVGTATTEKGAAAISQYFAEANLPGCGKMLNVTDRQAVIDLVDAIKAEQGVAPLILVNNAGITRDNLMLRMKDDEWLDVVDTNLNGTFYVTKACLKAMVKARWGRVINISSIVGSNGNPGQANYSATKAAINAFSKSLAKEVASRGITVNAIAPGFIETDMTAALTDEQRKMILAAIPAAAIGTVDDIAAMVAFLAADGSSYVTGQVMHVNGGMY